MVFDKVLAAFAFLSPTGAGSSTSGWEMLSVILLTMLIAYIIGVMISHIVDRKLGDIAIKIPQIKIDMPPTPAQASPEIAKSQPPQIVFRISEDLQGKINLQPINTNDDGKAPRPDRRNKRDRKRFMLPKESVFTHKNKIPTYEPFLSVTFDESVRDDLGARPKNDSRLAFDDSQEYKNSTQQFTVDTLDYPIVVETTPPPTQVKSMIGCAKDSDCNGVYGDGKNVCKSDGSCHCVSGSGTFCHLGPTNYRDPKDMTPDDRERFKAKFRNNMTLQDYKNWLFLYKDEIENLRQHHRRNLLKLLRGGQLTERDVPSVQLKPPTDAADYFQKMYKGGKISVHFPDNDSPLVGANFNQYTDFIAPENTASSWITGVVDLYKETKDDAKALDWSVRPDTSSGLEEQSVGDTYQKYLSKQHDFADLRLILDKANPGQLGVRQSQAKSLQTFNSRDINVESPQ